MLFGFYAIYIFIYAVTFADVLFHPGFIQKRLLFDPWIYTAAVAIILFLFRGRVKKKYWQKSGIVSTYYLAPVAMIAAIIVRVIELATYPNFVYTHVYLDPAQIVFFSLQSAVIGCVLLDWAWVKRNFKAGYVVAGLLLYSIMLLYWPYHSFYKTIVREDHVIEYATAGAFLSVGIIAFLGAWATRQFTFTLSQKRIMFFIFILLGFGGVFIAGEEISWGHRIFELEVPAEIAKSNTQGELNIHNNQVVFSYVYYGYLLVALYGLISWILYELAVRTKLTLFWKLIIRLVTSRWYFGLFFLPSFLYATARLIWGKDTFDEWEEVTELYLALGLLFTVYLNVRYLKRKRLKSIARKPQKT